MLPHCSPGSWLVCGICLKLTHIRMAALALLHEGQFREFREFAMFHEELPIRFWARLAKTWEYSNTESAARIIAKMAPGASVSR